MFIESQTLHNSKAPNENMTLWLNCEWVVKWGRNPAHHGVLIHLNVINVIPKGCDNIRVVGKLIIREVCMGSLWPTSASEVLCPVLEAQHVSVRWEIDVTNRVIPMNDKALFCCKFFCFFSLSAPIFLCMLTCTCLKVLSPQGIKLICDVRLFWWQDIRKNSKPHFRAIVCILWH